MADHDPRAADVLMASIDRTTDEGCGCCPNTAEAYTTHALNALTAAGLVVRPADEYERVTYYIHDEGYGHSIYAADSHHDAEDCRYCRPLYVRKENLDDV